ncbi:ABC transporter substrate-binding protein [Coralliovum pocilloporae]|uniref:ABC transporter substrate-binding protein n=1 Tax=Coralliovum pocilloporae TaxID=3066369 RepID=UPI00330715B7
MIQDDMKQIEWLRKRLAKGTISRREFMGRTSALGLGAAAAMTFAGEALAAGGPKKGGTLKLAIPHGSTTDSIDPARLENGFQTTLTRAMGNTLTEIDAEGNLVGALAESWEASPDAKVWTFKLRRGVEFHNGKSLTADDVIASINYHRTDDTKSSVKPLAKPITAIRKDDEHTIVFELEGGNADFPFNLDTPGFMIVPSNSDGSINWQEGAGTGGYKLVSYEPGVKAILERNPNYWRNDRAHFDSAEMLTILDKAARTNALISGEVDVIDQVDLKTAHLLGRRKNIHIEETSGPLHYTFPMLTKSAPFDDLNVRQALKFAIDREEILQKVLHGHGSIGNDNPIGPSYRYYAADLERNGYDPEKAKYHLKKAGLSELSVDLSAADAAFGGAVDAAVLYKEHAAKAGININVVREPNDGYWSNVWLKKPFCACYWGGYATEDTMFSTGYEPSSSWNDTNWDHTRFNSLLIEARSELDETKRRELYREMQVILRDEGGTVVPFFANNVMARTEKVAHGTLSSQASLDGRRIIERWWSA